MRLTSEIQYDTSSNSHQHPGCLLWAPSQTLMIAKLAMPSVAPNLPLAQSTGTQFARRCIGVTPRAATQVLVCCRWTGPVLLNCGLVCGHIRAAVKLIQELLVQPRLALALNFTLNIACGQEIAHACARVQDAGVNRGHCTQLHPLKRT